MNIDMAYFTKERASFQEIMGDSRYTPEQVSNALRGLLTVYLKLRVGPGVSRDDIERAEIMMQSASIEHDRRLAYRVMHEPVCAGREGETL